MKLASYIPLFVFVLLSTSCSDAFKNQVTVYPVLETKDLGLLPLNRTVYKVFPESQTVIYWIPGIDEIPRKLGKCVVRDRLHWQCEYLDGSAMLMMNDSEFKVFTAKKENYYAANYEYVSCWKWWLLQIKGIIK
jgi:hypothetical protein